MIPKNYKNAPADIASDRGHPNNRWRQSGIKLLHENATPRSPLKRKYVRQVRAHRHGPRSRLRRGSPHRTRGSRGPRTTWSWSAWSWCPRVTAYCCRRSCTSTPIRSPLEGHREVRIFFFYIKKTDLSLSLRQIDGGDVAKGFDTRSNMLP